MKIFWIPEMETVEMLLIPFQFLNTIPHFVFLTGFNQPWHVLSWFVCPYHIAIPSACIYLTLATSNNWIITGTASLLSMLAAVLKLNSAFYHATTAYMHTQKPPSACPIYMNGHVMYKSNTLQETESQQAHLLLFSHLWPLTGEQAQSLKESKTMKT